MRRSLQQRRKNMIRLVTSRLCFAQTKTQWRLPLRFICKSDLLSGCAVNQLPSARIFAFKRLLVRAALLRWIRPLLTMVSIFGTASL